MKLINSKVEIIPQGWSIDDIYKQIERAGRTCYKSEDKITESSSVDFVKRMINNKHTAMLEHGTVYLTISYLPSQTLADDFIAKYQKNPYSKVEVHYSFDGLAQDHIIKAIHAYITTNMRVIQENNWLDDLRYLCEPTVFHHKRITVRFTCDRGVSHELVRHRVFSFAQESTRYCNYSKDKFGNELTFIIPSWLELMPGTYTKEDVDSFLVWTRNGDYINTQTENKGATVFLNALRDSEYRYLKLLDEYKLTPQQARQVLPNALKTEVVMTGFMDDWDHFFDLRCAPSAHPDMRVLAMRLEEMLHCTSDISRRD